jgi:hypothetical protein
MLRIIAASVFICVSAFAVYADTVFIYLSDSRPLPEPAAEETEEYTGPLTAMEDAVFSKLFDAGHIVFNEGINFYKTDNGSAEYSRTISVARNAGANRAVVIKMKEENENGFTVTAVLADCFYDIKLTEKDFSFKYSDFKKGEDVFFIAGSRIADHFISNWKGNSRTHNTMLPGWNEGAL